MAAIQLYHGLSTWANYCFGVAGDAPYYAIDFFTNDFTPTRLAVLSDFTLLSLPGWSQFQLPDAVISGVSTNADGSQVIRGGSPPALIAPYSGSPVTVHGWVLIDVVNGVAIQAERYTTPIVLPLTGTVLYAPFTATFGHYAP